MTTGSAGVPGQSVTGSLVVGLNNGGVPLLAAEYAPGMVGVYVITLQVPVDTQTGPAVRRSNQAHDRREVDERRAAPIHRDVGEQAVLDLVPLTGAGREVTHRDGETGASGELLQLPLPQNSTEPGPPVVDPSRRVLAISTLFSQLLAPPSGKENPQVDQAG